MDFPKSVPSVGLVNGKFIDEDALAGTPGSLIPSAWGNAITQEILSVVEAAGFLPDEEKTDQLLQAIDALVTNAVPSSATELQAGVAEIATSQDMADGTDDDKIATAKKIKMWFANVMKQATESAFGWAKVATQTQANSGADDFAFITSKKLSGTIAALIVQATETISGIAKLATQSQTNDGTDDATIVTPKKLAVRLADGIETTLGYNQTTQDMTGSRAANVTYTNSTGRPIFIVVQVVDQGGSGFTFAVNGVVLAFNDLYVGSTPVLSFIIPPGGTYGPLVLNGNTLAKWMELR